MTLPRDTLVRAPAVEAVDFDLTGTELGPWRLERIMGEGAMGTVYAAKHQRIGRTAAVKVLKAEHAGNPDLVHRFIAEATAVNAIRNEHIVEVFDFGEQRRPDGTTLAYCVMELLEGTPLSDVMAQHFTVARTTKLALQLTKALAAAHQIGVVHRDVKPENMFLSRRPADPEFLKVLDFGIAKLLKPIGDLPQSGTAAGVVIGTPEYMAPEQALGAPTDRRADLYAVGLLLYELLAGRQPFTADTFGKLVVEISSKPPPPLPDATALGEPIHPTLKAIVKRCLEKDPNRRFQSAEELGAALEPFVTGAPIAPLAPTPVPLTPSVIGRVSALRDSVIVQRSKGPMVVVGLVLVSLLGVAVALFFPADTSRRPPGTAQLTATHTPPAKVMLTVTSTPAGAKVTRLDTGLELGVTPLSVEVEQIPSAVLVLTLPGHEAVSRSVALSKSAALSVELPALARPVPR